jgi:hypothetical protein
MPPHPGTFGFRKPTRVSAHSKSSGGHIIELPGPDLEFRTALFQEIGQGARVGKGDEYAHGGNVAPADADARSRAVPGTQGPPARSAVRGTAEPVPTLPFAARTPRFPASRSPADTNLPYVKP